MRRRQYAWLVIASFAFAITVIVPSSRGQIGEDPRKGYNIARTGLTPKTPEGCASSFTSLYASWVDVDGSRRDEIHSGIDGGRLRDWILSPAPGTIRAIWKANWGWGWETAVLILHTAKDLGIGEGRSYYSEFDHLGLREARRFQVGQAISRGERLARVFRPGGKEIYLAEVHWEVWEFTNDAELEWHRNKYGARVWTNNTARLIDPLFMLSLEHGIGENGDVPISPFQDGQDYSAFKGFTYIFPCAAQAQNR